MLKSQTTGGRVVRFVITNRVLSGISLAVDGLMIFLAKEYGFWIQFIVAQPLFLAVCVGMLVLYDRFQKKGYDLLSMDYFHELRDSSEEIPTHRIFKRFTRWILRGNRLIFWFGSLWLEPDVVTLLLRKEKRFTIQETLAITLPSNILCITFWSIIFYLGVQGYEYFHWFIE